MARINIKNIALVLGVTVFNMGVGLYDRIINSVGILKWIGDAQQIASLNYHIPPEGLSLLSNTATSTNFLFLGLFVIVAVVIIGIITSALGSAGMS
jgi:hypothetical protein